MKQLRQFFAFLVSLGLLLQFAPTAKGCGPETLQPIFVFNNSPDPPFQEFTEGKIGIVQPSFGRKTLVIAYRYLNGGSFGGEEQKALVEALKGMRPEGDGQRELAAWLAARKEILKDEEELPTIYRQTEYSGYDFFPNCTSNAFEVATDTLKDRVARYGPDNASVREWLNGQDTVFQNCAGGPHLPTAIGADGPVWLRKDRDYQTAAAFFYSLQFDDARRRFELIAHDAESDWQQTADYLVGRTLVRQASLESNEKTKHDLYERAETYLLNLLGRTTKLRSGTQKLVGLIKYRLRPEERVRELAQVMEQSGNENLRQDLIDYVWLLDKFDQQIQKAEEERKKLQNPSESDPQNTQIDPKQAEQQKNFEAMSRGELIQLYLNPTPAADGSPEMSKFRQLFFKPDVTRAEIYQTFETALGRKLSDAEMNELNERQDSALKWRKWNLAPNRKLINLDYEGCEYSCNDLTLDLLPSFLTMDQLTDWIFTFQSDDPKAYSHALAKWRETQSNAWFIAALAKAPAKASSSLQRLLLKAQMVQPDTPLFPTVAYNRIRLLSELGRKDEARKLLDQILTTKADSFPLSAKNLLIEQRMQLAQNLGEFLRFASRKPVSFYEYGSMGTIVELLSAEKDFREEQGDSKTSERLEELMKWDGRSVFDENVVDVLNWHFPLQGLMAAAHDPALPDYLRERVLLTVWTRAVLLKNDAIARQVATELVEKGIDSNGVLGEYLKAATPSQREDAAIFALLKLPILSPYILPGVPDLDTGDDGYDFALAWWCTLQETTYDEEVKEVPKQVASPSFLTAEFVAMARKERTELKAIGDGKKYLGTRVIEWARQRPADSRLPEALFIAVMANQSFKYGCGGWEHDDQVREDAASLLKERYPNSVWANKLREMEQQ